MKNRSFNPRVGLCVIALSLLIHATLAQNAIFTYQGRVTDNGTNFTGIGQFKFTIPVKGSGVKIPLSVTFSNRTEFIKESKVRGNVGITFDLDTIFSKLKP